MRRRAAGAAPILHLPEEVLTSIVRQLENPADRRNVALTCSRFRQLETRSRRALTYKIRQGTPHIENLETLLTRCTGLEDFSVINDRGKSTVGDELLLAVGSRCSTLERLSLVGCERMTMAGWMSFSQRCSTLKSLELRLVTSASVCPPLSSFPSLSSLTLYRLDGLPIEISSLSLCSSLTSLSLWHLTDPLLSSLAAFSSLSTLHSLTLTAASVKTSLSALASFPLLSSLSFRTCSQIGPAEFDSLARALHTLTHLSIQDCPLLPSSAVAAITTANAGLSSLSLRGATHRLFSAVGLQAALTAAAGTLESLALSGIPSLRPGMLSACRRLKALRVEFGKGSLNEVAGMLVAGGVVVGGRRGGIGEGRTIGRVREGRRVGSGGREGEGGGGLGGASAGGRRHGGGSGMDLARGSVGRLEEAGGEDLVEGGDEGAEEEEEEGEGDGVGVGVGGEGEGEGEGGGVGEGEGEGAGLGEGEGEGEGVGEGLQGGDVVRYWKGIARHDVLGASLAAVSDAESVLRDLRSTRGAALPLFINARQSYEAALNEVEESGAAAAAGSVGRAVAAVEEAVVGFNAVIAAVSELTAAFSFVCQAMGAAPADPSVASAAAAAAAVAAPAAAAGARFPAVVPPRAAVAPAIAPANANAVAPANPPAVVAPVAPAAAAAVPAPVAAAAARAAAAPVPPAAAAAAAAAGGADPFASSEAATLLDYLERTIALRSARYSHLPILTAAEAAELTSDLSLPSSRGSSALAALTPLQRVGLLRLRHQQLVEIVLSFRGYARFMYFGSFVIQEAVTTLAGTAGEAGAAGAAVEPPASGSQQHTRASQQRRAHSILWSQRTNPPAAAAAVEPPAIPLDSLHLHYFRFIPDIRAYLLHTPNNPSPSLPSSLSEFRSSAADAPPDPSAAPLDQSSLVAFRGLKRLSLHACSGLKPEDFRVLLRACPRLEHLLVDYNDEFSNRVIAECRLERLVRFSAVACAKVTAEGVGGILGSYPKLQWLKVEKGKVTERARRMLLRAGVIIRGV